MEIGSLISRNYYSYMHIHNTNELPHVIGLHYSIESINGQKTKTTYKEFTPSVLRQ